MKTRIYSTWPLFAALLLLILNDHFFKYSNPGMITGKLSDFAGLFLITLVLRGLFEKKAVLISSGVIAGFVWWKSHYSQVVIDAINIYSPWLVVRTIDYSDLIALLIIPLAHYVYENREVFTFNRAVAHRIKFPMMLLTLLGMMGTSVIMPHQNYQIRKQEENHSIDIAKAIELMTQVLAGYELECVQCSTSDETGQFSSKDIHLYYRVLENNRGLEIDISGKPDGLFGRGSWNEMDNIQSTLQNTLGNNFTDMEFVMKLGEHPY